MEVNNETRYNVKSVLMGKHKVVKQIYTAHEIYLRKYMSNKENADK